MSIVAIVFAFLTTGLGPLIPGLRLLCCSFRRLQRIDRCCAGESTTLSRWLLGLDDHHVSVLGPGHAALHHQQVLVLVDTEHSQIAYRHLLIPHVSGHAHTLEHTRGKGRGSDRSRDLEHRTVRLRAAPEMMPLDHALKPATFADSYDVDELLAIENLDQHPVTDLHGRAAIPRRLNLQRYLAHEFHGGQIVFRQMPLGWLGEARFFHEF